MYKLSFYVPTSHLESVKQALFKKGAGKMGSYDCCAWQTKGIGQFRPLPGSHPSIGKINQLEEVEEYQVDMACEDSVIKEVIAELRAVHPYEEAAFACYKINEL